MTMVISDDDCTRSGSVRHSANGPPVSRRGRSQEKMHRTALDEPDFLHRFILMALLELIIIHHLFYISYVVGGS